MLIQIHSALYKIQASQLARVRALAPRGQPAGMYMTSHWKVLAIKQIWFTNLSDNILHVLESKSILSTIWPRTFHFPGGSILLILLFYFGFDLILPRFNNSASQSHRSQSKRLNSTISGERKKFVVRSLRSSLIQKY